MVFPILFQVFGQLINPIGQQRNLDIRTTGVFIVQPKRAQINSFTRGHSSQEG
jgi:hypothetical protein